MSNIPTRESTAPNGRRWKPIKYPGFGHYDVSSDGQVMNRLSGRILAVFWPTESSPIKWVFLSPDKATGYKARNYSVAKLVYEAFSGHELPARTQIKFKDQSKDKNGRYLNYHFDNLYVDGDVVQGGPVTVINLPVIKPESSKPTAPLAPAMTERERRAIERYNKMIEQARELVLCSDAMLSVEDIDALNLEESDYIDVLEGMSIEQTAHFFRRLIQIAREAAKGDD